MKKLIGAFVLAASFVNAASATVLHYRDASGLADSPGTTPYFNSAHGGGHSVESLLTAEGINNPAYETADTTFTVAGTGTVSVTFNFLVDTGTFNGHFGFYDVNAMVADRTDINAYRAEVVNTATHVFDDRRDVTRYVGQNLRTGTTPTSYSFDIAGGTELGFVLWPNGRNHNVMLSENEFNNNNIDQMLAFIGGGTTLFTFADRYNDDDYTDLSFSVETEFLVNDITPPPADAINASAPGALALVLLGLAGIGARRRKAA